MINPDNKDHLLQLSSCLLINLDEFDSLNSNRLADLKRIITQDSVNERKAFDIQNYTFVRRASFAASTNNPYCLQDIGENRRILFNKVHHIDYHYAVPYEGLYAQALALYRSGFRFWYEGDEVANLNRRNERFRLKDPVEENLFHYYRAARPGELNARWYPASHMLATLSLNGRTQSTRFTQQTLVTVLDSHQFLKRRTEEGMYEYCVAEYTLEERNARSLRSIEPVQREIENL